MWIETFNEMRKRAGLSLDELSEKSGVPKSTLSKISAGITKAPPLETMKKLVYSMGYTLDELDRGLDVDDTPSIREKFILKKYRALDTYGKEAVDSVLDVEYRRCKGQASPAPLPDTAAELEDMKRRLDALEQEDMGEGIAPDLDAGLSASTDTEKLA